MEHTSNTCNSNRTGKYGVLSLSREQRKHLEKLIRSGNAPARVQTRARILLLLDGRDNDAQLEGHVASTLLVHRDTVRNVRRRFASEGLDRALYEAPRPGASMRRKITGEVEAQLSLLACSEAPEGHGRWTLQLLADKLVELGVVDSLSGTAVGDALKKTRSSHGGSPASVSANRRASSSR